MEELQQSRRGRAGWVGVGLPCSFILCPAALSFPPWQASDSAAARRIQPSTHAEQKNVKKKGMGMILRSRPADRDADAVTSIPLIHTQQQPKFALRSPTERRSPPPWRQRASPPRHSDCSHPTPSYFPPNHSFPPHVNTSSTLSCPTISTLPCLQTPAIKKERVWTLPPARYSTLQYSIIIHTVPNHFRSLYRTLPYPPCRASLPQQPDGLIANPLAPCETEHHSPRPSHYPNPNTNQQTSLSCRSTFFWQV